MKNPIPASISQVKTMSRYVRIVFDTQETLTPEQKAELFDLYDQTGWVYFLKAPDAEIKTEGLPEIQLEQGEKSPSQRLRGALFVFWDQNVRGKKNDAYSIDFELFYRQQMDRIISQVKERLS